MSIEHIPKESKEKYLDPQEPFERLVVESELAQLAIINSPAGVYDASQDNYVNPAESLNIWGQK